MRSVTPNLQIKPTLGGVSHISKLQDVSQASSQLGTQTSGAESQLIEKVVDKVNEVLNKQGHEIQFQIDKATGFSVVQIRDAKTNEIIQQIPSEQMLKLAKTLGQEPGQLMNTIA